MIPPFTDEHVRLAMSYNTLTINDPNDEADNAYQVNVVVVEPQYDHIIEPRSQDTGSDGYNKPRRVQTLIRLDGMVHAQSFPALLDKVRDLNAAFDMVNAWIADSASTYNRGFLPFAFQIPTEDVDNYATGIIDAFYLARSLKAPVSRSSQYEGRSCSFSLALLAADPRMYFQTLQTASGSNAGTINTDNSLAGFESWPVVTITLTGAGSQIVSLALDGTDFRIDLTGIASGHEITIDMEHHLIQDNGTDAPDLFVSGSWWTMPPDDVNLVVSNISGTLAASVEVAWYRALA